MSRYSVQTKKEYLMKHKIPQFLQEIAEELIIKRPEPLIAGLVECLEARLHGADANLSLLESEFEDGQQQIVEPNPVFAKDILEIGHGWPNQCVAERKVAPEIKQRPSTAPPSLQTQLMLQRKRNFEINKGKLPISRRQRVSAQQQHTELLQWITAELLVEQPEDYVLFCLVKARARMEKEGIEEGWLEETFKRGKETARKRDISPLKSLREATPPRARIRPVSAGPRLGSDASKISTDTPGNDQKISDGELLMRSRITEDFFDDALLEEEETEPHLDTGEIFLNFLEAGGMRVPSLPRRSPPLTLRRNPFFRGAEPWPSVTIFISSTFRDFIAERNHLCRLVFPAIKTECANRKINFNWLDFRWGITREENEIQSLGIERCLQGIDSCVIGPDPPPNQKKFFFAMLGERGGWVPEADGKHRENVSERHRWVREERYKHCSITELEIQYAFLRDTEKGEALLWLRDSDFLKSDEFRAQVPGGEDDWGVPGGDEALVKLKREIVEKGGERWGEYKVEFDGWNEIDGVRLRGMCAFGSRAYASVMSAIDRHYPPERNIYRGVRQGEKDIQDWLVIQNSKFHFERKEVTMALFEYITSPAPDGILFIVGGCGVGKTASISKFISLSQEREIGGMVFHIRRKFETFVDVCSSLSHELDRLANDGTVSFDATTDEFNVLKIFFQRAATVGGLTLILDGLENAEILRTLRMFREAGLVDSAWIIITCLEVGVDIQSILDPEKIKIFNFPNLNSELEKKSVANEILKQFDKKMDGTQLDILCAKLESNIPLYISLAINELLDCPDFSKITGMLKNMPDTCSKIVTKIFLPRVFSTFGDEAMADLIGMILLSNGILISEIQEIIKLRKEKYSGKHEECTDTYYARVGAISYLLEPLMSQFGDSELAFSHKNIADALLDEILGHEFCSVSHIFLHRRLADYYWNCIDPKKDLSFDRDNRRSVTRLVQHLVGSFQWENLDEIQCNPEFIILQIEEVGVWGVMRLVEESVNFIRNLSDHTAPVPPDVSLFPNDSLIDYLNELRKFLAKNISSLELSPKIIFDLAIAETLGGGEASAEISNPDIYSAAATPTPQKNSTIKTLGSSAAALRQKAEKQLQIFMKKVSEISAASHRSRSAAGEAAAKTSTRFDLVSVKNMFELFSMKAILQRYQERGILSGRDMRASLCIADIDLMSKSRRAAIFDSLKNQNRYKLQRAVRTVKSLSKFRSAKTPIQLRPLIPKFESPAVKVESPGGKPKKVFHNCKLPPFGKNVSILETHKRPILSLCNFRDLVISGGADDMISVWREGQSEPKSFLAQLRQVTAVVKFSENFLLAAGSNGVVKLFQVGEEGEINTNPKCSWLTHKRGVMQAVAIPNSNPTEKSNLNSTAFATCSKDGFIKIFKFGESRAALSLSAHTGHATCLLALDEKRMVSGGGDKLLHIFDMSVEKRLATLAGHEDTLRALARIGEHTFAAGSQDGYLKVWDLRSNKNVFTHRGYVGGAVTSVLLFNDHLAIGGGTPETTNIQILDFRMFGLCGTLNLNQDEASEDRVEALCTGWQHTYAWEKNTYPTLCAGLGSSLYAWSPPVSVEPAAETAGE